MVQYKVFIQYEMPLKLMKHEVDSVLLVLTCHELQTLRLGFYTFRAVPGGR